MNRLIWIAPLAILLVALLLVGRRPPGVPAPGPAASAAARIVSLAPSLTDVIVALGSGGRIVGATDWCEGLPEGIPRLGGLEFDVETILALEPDRVVAIETRAQEGLLSLVAEQGIAVETFPAESVEDLLATIERLGRTLESLPQAKELARSIEDALEPPAVGAADPVPAVFVVQRDPLLVAGGGSFVTAMMRAAGLGNAFGDGVEHYRSVLLEELLLRDPVLILDASFDDAAAPMEFWRHFDGLRAVRDAGVSSFPPVRPGPMIPAWVERMRVLAGERRD